MSLSWFERLIPSILSGSVKKKNIPQGLWEKCPKCTSVIYRADLIKNLYVCPKCSFHMPIGARQRLHEFLDDTRLIEIGADLKPYDKLKFKDVKKYKDRLSQAQEDTDEKEALVVLQGKISDIPVVACAFEFSFMAGTMGSVVGDKFVLAVEQAKESSCPLICFSASGGARMQESLFALMQMAKTSAALADLSEHGLPFISVMVNPCMGGVSASLAMLGDINIAEPNALIGFSGPKIIKETIKEELPENFQSSESLFKNGFLDMIVDRRELKKRIVSLVDKLMHNVEKV